MKSSLASYEQEKQAKQTNITNSILPAPKNRFDAVRKEKLVKNSSLPNSQSRPASPSLSAAATTHLGMGPTSAPTTQDEVKMQAMKTPIIHLLAIDPLSSEEIVEKTHIPKDDLSNILQKVGKNTNRKWQLTDRAYRDLDVFEFRYQNRADRQRAIDNAVKAYDRMRLGKDESLWQKLLPKDKRGQSIVLSKLHLGGGQVNRALTPNYQPSPMPDVDGPSDSRVASAANTPKLGPSSTPRLGNSKSEVMKRMLSKDPKKAYAAYDAKEKKRKEREAAASDREVGKPAKKQTTEKNNPKIKSAEFVNSSDEDSGEEGEVNERPISQSKTTKEPIKAAAKPKPKTASSTSPDSSDPATKVSKLSEKPAAKAKPTPKTTASPAIKASNTPKAGKNTPQAANTLSAPNSHRKSQRSPQNAGSRPNVPSPLGAARPRVASDVSDRGAVGVQKVKQGGAETPKGLGITNGARKRQGTVTSTDSELPDKSKKKINDQAAAEQKHKPTPDGTSTPKATLANGVSHKTESGVKRKVEDSHSQQQESEPNMKHRKTDSSASQFHKLADNSNVAVNGNHVAPDGPIDGDGSDSAASVIDTITYNQGVAVAEKFRDIYYPAYAKLYDEQAATEARGEKVSTVERQRLLDMHKRLEQMKREIAAAARRQE